MSERQQNFEQRLAILEAQIAEISRRNARVENDKAWETSTSRVLTLTAATYVIAAVLLMVIGAEHYLLNAFIPAGGYWLSTRTLPLLKNSWLSRRRDAGDKSGGGA